MKNYFVFGIVLFSFVASLDPSYATKIQSRKLTDVTENSAHIEFILDEKKTCQIKYGSSPSTLNKVSISLSEDKIHKFSLTSLEKGQTVYYRLLIPEANGEFQKLPIDHFVTRGIAHPSVVNFRIKEKTIEGGTLVFSTNTPTRHTFDCGMDTGYGFQGLSKDYQKTHIFTVTNFPSLTKIYYRVIFENSIGETCAVSGNFISGENNAALHAKVTGTFTLTKFDNYLSESPPYLERITDGKLDYFKGMAASNDPEKADQWVQLDLGKIITVSRVLTYWRSLAYPEKFSVLLSMDGKNWKSLGDNFDAGKGSEGRSETGDPLKIHSIDAKKSLARYVKLFIPKGSPCHQKFRSYNFVQLFEMKIYPVEIMGYRIDKK